MTEEHQKEQFSIAYIHAVASVAGYKIRPEKVDDESIDIEIASSGDKGSVRNPRLEAQLKCTSQDFLKDDGVHFPLPIKNYNDLRKETLVPKILIVLLVPEEVNEWIDQNEERLIMYKGAYWISLREKPAVNNVSTVTVILPKENIINPQVLNQLMDKIDKNKQL